MRLQGLKVGFVLTGSHCTLDQIYKEIEKVIDCLLYTS